MDLNLDFKSLWAAIAWPDLSNLPVDSDVLLVIGAVLGWLALPAALSAFSDRRSPRLAMVLMLLAAGAVWIAFLNKPEGYTWAELPDVFFNVLARFL